MAGNGKRMTRQETRWQKKSEAASHWKQPHTTTFLLFTMVKKKGLVFTE